MSLEVLDFTTRKKIYKFEAGEFYLKPPYMNLVGETEGLIKEIAELLETPKGEKMPFEKIMECQLRLLRSLLEESEKGKLVDLTIENLRQDVVQEVVQDFFYQLKR